MPTPTSPLSGCCSSYRISSNVMVVVSPPPPPQAHQETPSHRPLSVWLGPDCELLKGRGCVLGMPRNHPAHGTEQAEEMPGTGMSEDMNRRVTGFPAEQNNLVYSFHPHKSPVRGICYGNCTKGKNWNRSERSQVMLLFRIRKSSETKPLRRPRWHQGLASSSQ